MPVLPSDITVIVMLTTNGFNREPKICYPGFLLKLEAEQKGFGFFCVCVVSHSLDKKIQTSFKNILSILISSHLDMLLPNQRVLHPASFLLPLLLLQDQESEISRYSPSSCSWRVSSVYITSMECYPSWSSWHHPHSVRKMELFTEMACVYLLPLCISYHTSRVGFGTEQVTWLCP